MKKTFVGLDVLRFGLALYLMTFHTIFDFPGARLLPLHELLGMGGVATSTFFILSGFILSHVYFGRGETTIRGGTRDFFVKRLTNLYPINWIALLLYIVVVFAARGHDSLTHYQVVTMVGSVPDAAPGTLALWLNRVLAVTMLDTWNPLYVTLNPPAWSLSVLFFFYVCFPFIAPRLLTTVRPWQTLLAILVVYLVPPFVASVFGAYGTPWAGLVTANPILRLPEFMAGIALYGMYRRGLLDQIMQVRAWKALGVAFFAACFCGMAWLIEHGASYWTYIVHNGAMLPAELVLLLVFAQSMEGASQRVRAVCGRLGNAALSIFAIHLSIFFIFYKVIKFVAAGISPIACWHQRDICVAAYKASEPTVALFPIFIVVTVIVAVIFQERLVVPLRDALRRRFVRGAVSAAPVAHSSQSPSTHPT